tara:strand:+ start:788 stop:1657 length:870 start_codon:yes stop_codon:yes gene_type:complete
MYYDEDEMLNLRLNILNKYVDKFIVAESKFTHSGKIKDKNFDINKFSKFKNKINYFYIEKEPKNISKILDADSQDEKNNKKILNAMARDNFQRNCLSDGIRDANDEDLIILSDLDEIPNLENVEFEKIKNNILLFEQKIFYYKFNLLYPNFLWYGSKACKKKNFLYPQWLRNIKNKKYPFWRFDTFFSKKKYQNIYILKDGGWHFTNIKSPEQIHNKMINFAHHFEYEKSNFSENDMKNFIKNRVVFYDHFSDKNKNRFKSQIKLEIAKRGILPKYLIENIENYKDWVE